MANNRNLKAFVRMDGSGRVVSGSLILRKQKPKVGRWIAVQTYECCNDRTFSFTIASATMTNVTLRLYCNGVLVDTLQTTVNTTTAAGVVIALNNAFGEIGTFSTPSGLIINMVMTDAQMKAVCPVGTVSFDVVPFASTTTTTSTTTTAP